MTIHDTHPFPTPDDPVRRLRARLGGTVSLWTTAEPAGLTVSSLMVANGQPARVVALIDPDSDLADDLGEDGAAVVQLLSWRHRDLAEAFAGATPAPGGPFRLAEFTSTAWGPRLADATTWAGVRLESTRPVGWSLEVTASIEELVVGEDDEPLFHRRGRYAR
ncbi:flavin reductase [Nocardioides sp. CER19]|uniref:flavin reductase family protein n=1 Tax=Nocardioides sp. CER19 TaxID=3038538 RepID=UPI002446839C|nr:flavin reductase [Nocardioides sp. CER19]MDH2416741.1 flavin reductase [Nocardioides sp. CER19]